MTERARKLLRECVFFALLPFALFILIAFISYHPGDEGWSHASGAATVRNFGGRWGAWIADLWLYLFGSMAFLFPLALAVWAWHVLRGRAADDSDSGLALFVRVAGLVLLLVAGCALAVIHGLESGYPAGPGGVLGAVLGDWFADSLGRLGSTVLLLAVGLIGLTLATGMSWLRLMDHTGGLTLQLAARAAALLRRVRDWWAGRQMRRQREAARLVEPRKRSARPAPRIEPALELAPLVPDDTDPFDPPAEAPAVMQPRPPAAVTVVSTATAAPAAPRPLRIVAPVESRPLPWNDDLAEGQGGLPPLGLLDEPRPTGQRYTPEALEALSRQVEQKLREFRIEAQVVNALPGPVITRFEMQPAPGVRGSQISSLDKDIARGLSKVSVRVVDVIPGKSVVGLEIPNESRETVFLSEILRSREFEKAASPLTLALGKDISGRPVVADVAKMPHLLVAGTTGSGKSVGLNAMILSFLYKASAEDVRMIMIDPKMLELSVYEGIPHLLAPVVTDMKEAANALRWCVAEMERRYKLMAAMGVRNLAGFNRKVKDALATGQPIPDPLFNPAKAAPGAQPETLNTLPYIVVVIDEFADMMMIVGKKVEELIARLAQKARAAGIHLILATQRPSVDVITGLIKANIPTRMAFQVSTKIDSRTILDQSGAETLLGHGDMLYLPPGTAQPERIHGAFVDDHEVHNVVAWLKQNGPAARYVESILNDTQELEDGRVIGETGLPEERSSGESGDQLYDQAVRVVTESRRASISYVQRRLKIGYNRAARLIEEMEQQGVVSAAEHNGDRQVLAPPPPEH